MNDATLSTVRLPEAQVPRTTRRAKMDEVIDRLLDGATKFSALPLHERIALARTMQNGYMRVAEASVKATCAAKGIPPEHYGAEWALGPWIPIRALRLNRLRGLSAKALPRSEGSGPRATGVLLCACSRPITSTAFFFRRL